MLLSKLNVQTIQRNGHTINMKECIGIHVMLILYPTYIRILEVRESKQCNTLYLKHMLELM